MNLVLFDFYGAIVQNFIYDKYGWEHTALNLNISKKLNNILENKHESTEMSNYFKKIQEVGKRKKIDYENLINYFHTSDISIILDGIMKMRESYTMTSILEDQTSNNLMTLRVGLIDLLERLSENNNNLLGIITSSKKTIVSSLLEKIGLTNLFQIIIEEEDIYSRNYSKEECIKTIFNQYNDPISSAKKIKLYYISDNESTGMLFAKNFDAKYIKSQNDMKLVNI